MRNPTSPLPVQLLLVSLLASAVWFAVPPNLHATPPAPPTCASIPASHQLDFWIGDWTVSAPGSAPNAASQVSLALDRCMVVERWDGGRGHTGQNTFAYSPDDKTWHGIFVDNRGSVHVFIGKAVPNGVEFSASKQGQSGSLALDRVRIVRLALNKVEQIWEKSTDNGATWTTEFRGLYQRAHPE